MPFELRAEKGLVIRNTLFEHKDIHKYTWMGYEERGGRGMLDYISGRTVEERTGRRES